MVNASRSEEYGRVRLTDTGRSYLTTKRHELVLGQVSDTQIHTDDHRYACDRWAVKENHDKKDRSSSGRSSSLGTDSESDSENSHDNSQ